MNMAQKINKLVSVLSIMIMCCSAPGVMAQTVTKFDRSTFFTNIASKDLNAINSEIDVVQKSEEKQKEAFEGALMMKRAGLLSGPAKKLKEFKAGRIKLEGAIDKDQKNPELKFLRLIIQENAPGILGYNKELEEDHKYVVANFKTLPEATQKAIRDYSKTSKIFTQSDF